MGFSLRDFALSGERYSTSYLQRLILSKFPFIDKLPGLDSKQVPFDRTQPLMTPADVDKKKIKLLINMLKQHPQLLYGDGVELSLLWRLSRTAVGQNILLEIYQDNQYIFYPCHFNEAPNNGAHAGRTVLWWWVVNPRDDIIKVLSDLLKNRPQLFDACDFDASPKNGKDVGKSLLWCLSRSEAGCDFISKVFEIKPNVFDHNGLNVGPEENLPNRKRTVLWNLINVHCESDGASIILEKLFKNHSFLRTWDFRAGSGPGRARLSALMKLLNDGWDDLLDLFIDFLQKNPDMLFIYDLNEFYLETDNVRKGTVLWYMLYQYGEKIIELFHRNPQLITRCHLNHYPAEIDWEWHYEYSEVWNENEFWGERGEDQVLRVVSVLSFFVKSAQGQECLQRGVESNRQLLDTADLYAMVDIEPIKISNTILWYLSSSIEGREIFALCPHLLHKVNLNDGPQEGVNAGETVLWHLVLNPDLRKYFVSNPGLLEGCNLDAGPSTGPNAGETVLWRLVRYETGLELLQKLLELNNQRLDSCNLAVSPINEVDGVNTVLSFLLNNALGRNLLRMSPVLASRYQRDAALPQETLNNHPLFAGSAVYLPGFSRQSAQIVHSPQLESDVNSNTLSSATSTYSDVDRFFSCESDEDSQDEPESKRSKPNEA